MLGRIIIAIAASCFAPAQALDGIVPDADCISIASALNGIYEPLTVDPTGQGTYSANTTNLEIICLAERVEWQFQGEDGQLTYADIPKWTGETTMVTPQAGTAFWQNNDSGPVVIMDVTEQKGSVACLSVGNTAQDARENSVFISISGVPDRVLGLSLAQPTTETDITLPAVGRVFLLIKPREPSPMTSLTIRPNSCRSR